MSKHNRRIILAGAAPDTGNLGVSALFESTLTGLGRRLADAHFTVLDYGRGIRHGRIPSQPQPLDYECLGASPSKRLYRSDTLFRIRVAARLGGLANPAAQRLLGARVVLDVSGGDSFTDLYGPKRFKAVVGPKQIAIECNVPLVLLPQTYGPFQNPQYARQAAALVRSAQMAWARDEHSFGVLQELLGDAFDPTRHHCGVDMAFLLVPREPSAPVPKPIDSWIAPERESEVVGINVSGLIYLDPQKASRHYGFQADYRDIVDGLVRAILDTPNIHVVLVPHVIAPPGHYESDVEACRQVAERIRDNRVAVLPDAYDQAEIKYLISRLDWFCGTRMHSTIAALSTKVPCAAIAYSQKTLGVFETCGQGQWVIDPRSLDTQTTIDCLVTAFSDRELVRVSLAEALPGVLARAEEQLDAIADICAGRVEATR